MNIYETQKTEYLEGFLERLKTEPIDNNWALMRKKIEQILDKRRPCQWTCWGACWLKCKNL
jgi:hypothetical protein